MEGTEQTAAITVSDDTRTLGTQELVVIALKGQALPGIAPTLVPLIGPDTLVLPAMNDQPGFGAHWRHGRPHPRRLADAQLHAARDGRGRPQPSANS